MLMLENPYSIPILSNPIVLSQCRSSQKAVRPRCKIRYVELYRIGLFGGRLYAHSQMYTVI